MKKKFEKKFLLPFGGKAVTAMTVLGSVLGGLYGLGDELRIEPIYLEYLKGIVSFLSILTGVTFIREDRIRLEKEHGVTGLEKTTK